MDMPGQRRGSYGRRNLAVVNSIKNVVDNSGGLTGTLTRTNLAKAVTSPSPTVKSDVSHGYIIKAIYVILDVCGLGGTGVLNNYQAFLFKNPGANLTPPTPGSEGASNEKKFVFKTYAGMIMRNQDGNAPLHWEGWVMIPKRYQRMGTDDTIELVQSVTASLTGHFFNKSIYKWYR